MILCLCWSSSPTTLLFILQFYHLKMTVLIKVFLILIGFSLSAQGQSTKLTKISINDSVKIQIRIIGFYTWYADLIKRQKLNKEFNPIFIKDANGMTTLDFAKYRMRRCSAAASRRRMLSGVSS